MQVNEHLECFSQRPLSVCGKGLTSERQRGLTTCFDRTESGGLCFGDAGPAEVYTTCLFPLSWAPETSFTCASVPCLAGIGALGTTKKVTEECWARDYDLLIGASLNSHLRALGLCGALWGVILKHRTIQIHQSPVFFFSPCCWRIDGRLQCGDAKGQQRQNLGSLQFKKFFLLADWISILRWQTGEPLNMNCRGKPFLRLCSSNIIWPFEALTMYILMLTHPPTHWKHSSVSKRILWTLIMMEISFFISNGIGLTSIVPKKNIRVWVHILIVTILCVKWVNFVQKKWLRNTKSQSQQLRYRSGLGSILVLHSGDLSSRRDVFPPLPDISLANTHYLTWLWVCMCQPSQQSSNHIKVHTPRRCQIIAAPFFFFYLLVLMTCDSCSRGYFFLFWFFQTLAILFLCVLSEENLQICHKFLFGAGGVNRDTR